MPLAPSAKKREPETGDMKEKREKKDKHKQDFETHQVAYVDFTVEAAGKTWNFQRPTLVDHPDGKTGDCALGMR